MEAHGKDRSCDATFDAFIFLEYMYMHMQRAMAGGAGGCLPRLRFELKKTPAIDVEVFYV